MGWGGLSSAHPPGCGAQPIISKKQMQQKQEVGVCQPPSDRNTELRVSTQDGPRVSLTVEHLYLTLVLAQSSTIPWRVIRRSPVTLPPSEDQVPACPPEHSLGLTPLPQPCCLESTLWPAPIVHTWLTPLLALSFWKMEP